ncbi:MAG TPA: lamin tail domain-containing protein, partial [Myxococcota bacterium]|nr:lamin tail domain-containing protein [Myxococcota bacterium]
MTIVLLLLACVPDDPPPPVDTTDTVDTDPPVATPRVLIHEVMTRNDATLLDPDAPCAEYDDWIELLDADEVPVDLGGWRLGTRRDGSDAWTLPPTALSPGGYALITADATPDQGPLHAPFKLDGDGAEVWLWAPDGAAVDHVALPALAPDVSWGRLADGSFGPLPLPSPGAANAGWPDDPCLAPPTGFDDHTYPCIGSTDSYFVLSRARTGLRTVKFDILSFSDPAARRVVFLDTAFYDLHDEWYLFRMLNDQPVEGEDVYPPYPGAFADVDAIYTWADTIDLASTFDPGFITRAGLRITAPHYYELALDTDPRVIGVGVLVYAPPVDPADPPTWAFELEYGDTITVDEVTTYFEVLAAATPPEIGDHLRWLIRSPSQERTAASMEAGALPYHDRVLRYAELARPGEVEVYHPGLAAGRVRLVRAGEEGLDKAVPDDLLVLDAVPDELPPGAALLTAVPQTPLAHVALLAESRGIPNAYVAGITADPEWDQWGRVHAWVALRATADGGVRAQALTNPQIGEWNRIKDQPIGVFTPPDLTDAPLTVDLTTTPADQMDALRPILGGKCAGMLVLLDQGVDAPDAPLCVTVRAYADQIAALDWLPGVLADPMFAEPGDPRARYLVLEGARAYLQRYAGPGDRAFLTQHDAAHPPGDRLGDLGE